MYQVGHRQAEVELRAGFLGCIREEGVEDGTTWRVEGVHAGVRLQRDRRRLRAVVEGDAAYRWRAGRRDPVNQPPAPQLQHPATHECMGRQRVGAAAGPIHDQHLQAGAGEEQRRGGAGDPGAHDDRVPAAVRARPAAQVTAC